LLDPYLSSSSELIYFLYVYIRVKGQRWTKDHHRYWYCLWHLALAFVRQLYYQMHDVQMYIFTMVVPVQGDVQQQFLCFTRRSPEEDWDGVLYSWRRFHIANKSQEGSNVTSKFKCVHVCWWANPNTAWGLYFRI